MTNNPFEVLAINESRLDNNITDNLIKIQGYTIVRKDRDRHGVAFYIKNNIAFKVRSDLCYDDLEALTVQIEKPSQKSFLITTWYRPPSSEISIMSKFEQLLKNLEDCNKESIILGDFDCNILAKEIDAHASTILSLYNEYQHTQLIDNPTRVTENSSTLIDHLISNMLAHKVITTGVSNITIIDNYLIYAIHRNMPQRERPRLIETRNYKDFDAEIFLYDLSNQPWNNIKQRDDPNEMLSTWNTLFLNTLNTHAPIKRKRVRNTEAPWINPEIKRLMFERDNLKKKATVSKTSRSWELYQQARNKTNNKYIGHILDIYVPICFWTRVRFIANKSSACDAG
jgi:hypothetical protein